MTRAGYIVEVAFATGSSMKPTVSIALSLALLAFVGCGGSPTNGTGTTVAPSSPSDPRLSQTDVSATSEEARARLQGGSPIADEECQEFAQTLVGFIGKGEPDSAQELVDSNCLLDIAFTGLEKSERDRALLDLFRETYLKGIRKTNGFRTLARIAENGASFKYLGTKRSGQAADIVVRVTMEPDGFDYHRFAIARRPKGIRIIDAFVLRQAEWSSSLTRRLAMRGLAMDDPSTSGSDRDKIKQATKTIQLMGEDMLAGRYQGYLDKFETLPDNWKSDMSFLASRIDAAKRIGTEQYLSVVKDLRNRKPNDPAADILILDALAIEKDFGAAHACLDHIDKSIGHDPYLLVLHADCFRKESKLEDAKAAAQRALVEDPSLVGGLWQLARVSLVEKDFATTRRLLERIQSEHNVDLAIVFADEAYAEFVNSPEYLEWMKATKPQK